MPQTGGWHWPHRNCERLLGRREVGRSASAVRRFAVQRLPTMRRCPHRRRRSPRVSREDNPVCRSQPGMSLAALDGSRWERRSRNWLVRDSTSSVGGSCLRTKSVFETGSLTWAARATRVWARGHRLYSLVPAPDLTDSKPFLAHVGVLR